VLERILVGSVTTSLLRRAPCSLFVVPEPPFTEADRLRRLVSGSSESRTPDEWSAQLDAFTRRNAGRRVALESDYPLLGAETQETGFAFAGAAYDPHDRRVELMFGDADGGTAHLTRGITGIVAITVLTPQHGADVALRIDHSDGQTRLRFPSRARAPATPTFGLPCPTTIFTLGLLLAGLRVGHDGGAVPVRRGARRHGRPRGLVARSALRYGAVLRWARCAAAGSSSRRTGAPA
jgi:hypothetical protein